MGAKVQYPEVVRRKRRFIATVAGALVIILVAVFRLSPLWPGPALPDGATRLHLVTQAPHLVPTVGCQTALLGPVRITSSGEELAVLSAATGEPARVVWPSGWAAWLINGRAELAARDGSIIAREGDVIADRFGGGVGLDDAFHVCIILD